MSWTDPRPTTGPVRVFRADAPQEVASASIVAGALPPGRDILAIYGGGSYGPPETAIATMRAMARAHQWAAVVDISDLPVKEVSGTTTSLRERLARTRATAATVRGMHERLADVLGIAPSSVGAALDEVYTSEPTAGTMVTAYVLSSTAQMRYYPHTFMSVTGVEPYQLEFPRPLYGRASDLVKRLVWGPEVVPKRTIAIDLGITFWRPVRWATNTVSLSHLITAETMRSLFNALPTEVRAYFEQLANDCGPATGLLLLAPGDPAPHSANQDKIEQTGYARLTDHLIRNEGIESLVVKPHPRMPTQRVNDVTEGLAALFPQLMVVSPERYSSLPVEVVAAGFTISACAAIISTCLCTLPLIYPMQSYCDQAAAESLYGVERTRDILASWAERLPGSVSAI